MRESNRIILHIDFDSFFASVEQQCNPLFRDKPLGVTATNGRSCIIASSREAKRVGIKTGSRTDDALRICPTIHLVGADFVKYWEISKKFIAICNSFSPLIEVFSIDELFMDITYCAHLFGGTEGLINKLKQQIREGIGEHITVSVGVSHNKLLAKLASGLKKPNGVIYITPAQVENVYRVVQLTDICGIGTRIHERLIAMGIRTLLQLRNTPVNNLIGEFGNVQGKFLFNVGQGIDTRPVMTYTEEPPIKSIGRQYCLPANEHDQRIILQNIYELFEEIGIKLRRLNKKARSSGIWLSGAYTTHGHITQTRHIDTGSELFNLAMQVLKEKHGGLPVGYVRRIGVWAGYLEDTKNLTEPLFIKERRRERVIKIVDTLNERFGDHTIRNGFLANAARLTTVPNGFMADKIERRKLASEYFSAE